MSHPSHKIVFHGEVLPGFDRDAVQRGFAEAFKLSASDAARVFGHHYVVLKKQLDQARADAYVAKLSGIGMVVEVIATDAEGHEVATAPAPPAVSTPAVPPAAEPARQPEPRPAAEPEPSRPAAEEMAATDAAADEQFDPFADDFDSSPLTEMRVRADDDAGGAPDLTDSLTEAMRADPLAFDAPEDPMPGASSPSSLDDQINRAEAELGDDAFGELEPIGSMDASNLDPNATIIVSDPEALLREMEAAADKAAPEAPAAAPEPEDDPGATMVVEAPNFPLDDLEPIRDDPVPAPAAPAVKVVDPRPEPVERELPSIASAAPMDEPEEIDEPTPPRDWREMALYGAIAVTGLVLIGLVVFLVLEL